MRSTGSSARARAAELSRCTAPHGSARARTRRAALAPDGIQWLPKWHHRRRRPLPESENGLVRRVELRGLEPLTPTLPVWCATSCATAPCRPGLVCPSRRQLYRAAASGPRRGGGAPARAPPPGRAGSGLLHLRDAQVVAERVAQAEVDAVGLVDRLLGDLDALRLELGVGLVGVVGPEEQVASGGALGDQLPDLRGRLLTHGRRPGVLQQKRAV